MASNTQIFVFFKSKAVPPPQPLPSLQLKLHAVSVVSNHCIEVEHAEWYIGATLWQIDFSAVPVNMRSLASTILWAFMACRAYWGYPYLILLLPLFWVWMCVLVFRPVLSLGWPWHSGWPQISGRPTLVYLSSKKSLLFISIGLIIKYLGWGIYILIPISNILVAIFLTCFNLIRSSSE